MTVSSQICKRRYLADGQNRRWAVDFPYMSASQLKVYCTDANGNENEVTGACELDELNHEIVYPTLASQQSALPAGYTLTILRATTHTQSLHLTQQGVLDAQALEQGFDALTLQVQELAEQAQRCIQYPVSSNKTSADAQTFLTDLKNDQIALFNQTAEQVEETTAQLEQALVDETVARIQADVVLQNKLDTKQPVGNYVKQSDFVEQMAGKQTVLNTVQQSAVNSGITSAGVAQIQTNTEDISTLEDELYGWQKPADWVDIRSGALPNSVYFLVGHSADYATYPTFGLTAITSTGTYDVFVDGIKQATTASGTATTLNWQTLALTSGWDVTTPSALHTHIVRVTPTTSTATLTGIKTTLGANYGVLWAHFNVANPIDLDGLFNTSSNNDGTKRCYVLQAVTSYNNEIQVANKIEGAFHYCYVLKEIPTLVYAGASTSTKSGYRCFRSCYALRKVRLVNFGVIDANSMFMNASAIREIDTQNSSAMLANYAFQNCQSLKKLPNLTWGERAYLAFTNMYALEPTVLHANSNNLLYIGFTGSSGNKVALKGLTVSNEAPFTGGSPQINVSYTDLDRAALINLFNSMPTVSANQVCNITGTTGAADLTAEDLAIATTKGWTVTR